MRVPTILVKYKPIRLLVLYLLDSGWVRDFAERIPFSTAHQPKVS